MTRRAAICTPLRTPVGKFLGGLSSMNAGQLGAVILKALMERSGIDPERVDDVVFSQGYGNGEAPAIGHWSWLAAGLPIEVPGFQLDRRCGSGVQAVATAAMMVETGMADVVVAGGVESMSNVEHYTLAARGGVRMGDMVLHDRLSEQNGILDGAHPGDGAGLAGVSFHQRGIQFMAAFGVIDRAFAGVEQGGVFQHSDAGNDGLAGTATALQHGIAGIECRIQGFFIANLIFGRKLRPTDDPGSAVNDEGGFRRCGSGNGRHKQDSGKHGGLHGFYPDWQVSIIPNPAGISPDAGAPRWDRAGRPCGRGKCRKKGLSPWSRPPPGKSLSSSARPAGRPFFRPAARTRPR